MIMGDKNTKRRREGKRVDLFESLVSSLSCKQMLCTIGFIISIVFI